MNKSGMKPCPFCGHEITVYEIVKDNVGIRSLHVTCDHCGIEFRIESDYPVFLGDEPHIVGKTAIDKWNMRYGARKNEERE